MYLLLEFLKVVFYEDKANGENVGLEIVHIFIPVIQEEEAASNIRIDEDLKDQA